MNSKFCCFKGGFSEWEVDAERRLPVKTIPVDDDSNATCFWVKKRHVLVACQNEFLALVINVMVSVMNSDQQLSSLQDSPTVAKSPGACWSPHRNWNRPIAMEEKHESDINKTISLNWSLTYEARHNRTLSIILCIQEDTL